jgi:hypothetical protein
MAYVMNNTDIVEVTLRTDVNNQTCLTVLHYRLETAAPVADGGALVLGLLNNLNSAGGLLAKYCDGLAENVAMLGLRGQRITSARQTPIEVTPSVPSGQNAAGDCNNPSVAVAITKRSDFANRHGRGTIHFPGIPDAAYVAGLITNGWRDSVDPFELKVATPVTISTGVILVPVIYRRDNPEISYQVVSVSTETNIRTMRRRVVGRGI